MKDLGATIFFTTIVLVAGFLFYNEKEQESYKIYERHQFKLDSLKLKFKLDSLHKTHSCWSDKKTKPFPKIVKEDYEKEYMEDIARMTNY